MKQKLNEKSRKIPDFYIAVEHQSQKKKRINELMKQNFYEKSREIVDHETKIEQKQIVKNHVCTEQRIIKDKKKKKKGIK